MYFDTSVNMVDDYQIIKDEKKILLDKIYADETKRRHNRFNPFSN